jgi:hypothetical protein
MSGMTGFSGIDGFRGMISFMGANPSSLKCWCPATHRTPYHHFAAATSAVTATRWRQRTTRPQAST